MQLPPTNFFGRSDEGVEEGAAVADAVTAIRRTVDDHVDELGRGRRLLDAPAGSCGERLLDEHVVELPAEQDDGDREGGDETASLLLGDPCSRVQVVEDDVHLRQDRHPRRELDDPHPVVAREHGRDPGHDDLVVVDDGDADRRR